MKLIICKIKTFEIIVKQSVLCAFNSAFQLETKLNGSLIIIVGDTEANVVHPSLMLIIQTLYSLMQIA